MEHAYYACERWSCQLNFSQEDDVDKRVPIIVASQPLGTRSTRSLPLLHDTVSGTFIPVGQPECKTDALLWFGYDRHPGRP